MVRPAIWLADGCDEIIFGGGRVLQLPTRSNGFSCRRDAERASGEAHAEAASDFIVTEMVTKLDLEAALDRLTLRMTIRFGVMLVAGLGALAAILKLA